MPDADRTDASATAPAGATPSAPPATDTTNGVIHPPAAVQPRFVFGLPQDAQPYANAPQILIDDYEKALPEDPYGEETAPNARVWRAYVAEAAVFDNAMIGQARDGLDVLLVFVCRFRLFLRNVLAHVRTL